MFPSSFSSSNTAPPQPMPLLQSIHQIEDEIPQLGQECDCYNRYHFGDATQRLTFLGRGGLACLLLLLCALLAGLTLAVCSLDMVWLQVLSVAGSERERTRAVAISRIKRNAGWFLCSMIICSVACAESLPLLIQSLFGTAWLPIVIATVLVAVFAELLPQYIIPRHALFWAYYSWPFIWGCMWLTCIISWPVSLVLNKIAGPDEIRGIYTSEQLGVLVRLHERAEKHGGYLGPDAGRIMRGALDLDGRLLRGVDLTFATRDELPENDIERGDAIRSSIIVPWPLVKTIDINEEVTKAFIARVKGWSYSRIPVVGDVEITCVKPNEMERSGNGQKVFGFLHIRNLVGLELVDELSDAKKVHVKDLPLYPLPVVRDDLPLYDLLNMFQLGMSRLAVVIPTPVKDRLVPLSAIGKNGDALPRNGASLWSATTGLNNRDVIEMRALDAQVDWTTDFLDAAQNNTEIPLHCRPGVIGIGCPKPLGIVTFEDVLDALLQKTSRDEGDFFHRDTSMPPTKQRKAGDDTSVSSNLSHLRARKAVPVYAQKIHAAFERAGQNQGTLRKRNTSAPAAGNDGANDQGGYSSDSADEHKKVSKPYGTTDCSSYTQNSFGGFHRASNSVESIDNDIASALEIPPVVIATPPSIYAGTAPNVSAEKAAVTRCPIELKPMPRHSSRGVTASTPKLRRVRSFSRDDLLGPDERSTTGRFEQTSKPILPRENDVSHRHIALRDGPSGQYSLDVEHLSPLHAQDECDKAILGSPQPLRDTPVQPFVRSTKLFIFPNGSGKENLTLMTPAKELLRINFHGGDTMVPEPCNSASAATRKCSIHDDRTLLPSQSKRSLDKKLVPPEGERLADPSLGFEIL